MYRTVLLGLGHTNAEIVRRWQPQLGRELIAVTNRPVATYSGMLPGVLAERYEPAAMTIDLESLCQARGVEFIVGETAAVDVPNRRVVLEIGRELEFDSLVVGVGSVPAMSAPVVHSSVVAIKPMQTLLERLTDRVKQVRPRAHQASRGLRVVVVGGGVAALEVALCVSQRRSLWVEQVAPEVALVQRGTAIGEGLLAATAAKVRSELERRRIGIHIGAEVVAVHEEEIQTGTGEVVPADIVLWATHAVAAPIHARIDLPKDERGFLLTRQTLQSVSGDPVFAVGDSATIADSPTPKAGVYAVRHAPVLWENLQRHAAGTELISYRPQERFLKLLNLGDGRAIGEWRGWTFAGNWAWWLKDAIDRRFIARYQVGSTGSCEGSR